jgi:hypothetical protein
LVAAARPRAGRAVDRMTSRAARRDRHVQRRTVTTNAPSGMAAAEAGDVAEGA